MERMMMRWVKFSLLFLIVNWLGDEMIGWDDKICGQVNKDEKEMKE